MRSCAKPIDVDRLLALLQKHANLTWIIDEAHSRADEQFPQVDPRPGTVQAITSPSPDDLAVLMDLAMKGELPRLMKVADKIAAMDRAYQPFVNQLRPLVENFDEDGVWALLNGAQALQTTDPG